ncbi:MAG: NADH-quinone oxidoreductase subunit NuoK [Candidatus Riflebacteria bacterium]|nr:NADH-quinone oxidoreductase subunit NuoK [Candidatus Riflebacteria bacterium]
MPTLAPSLTNCLMISAIMFACGLFCVLARRNPVSILMGVELMLNAANLNLVAFSSFVHPRSYHLGHCFAIFVIVLAASEAAVFLALLLSLYQQLQRTDVDAIQSLKG